eukprot:jgi/Chrzof1/6407/Cz18g09150.t1
MSASCSDLSSLPACLASKQPEYTHPLPSNGATTSSGVTAHDLAFSVGVAHRLESGALTKAKVDHQGLLYLLYESRIQEGSRITLSCQLDTAAATTSAPKVGVAVDITAP